MSIENQLLVNLRLLPLIETLMRVRDTEHSADRFGGDLALVGKARQDPVATAQHSGVVGTAAVCVSTSRTKPSTPRARQRVWDESMPST